MHRVDFNNAERQHLSIAKRTLDEAYAAALKNESTAATEGRYLRVTHSRAGELRVGTSPRLPVDKRRAPHHASMRCSPKKSTNK